MTGSASARAKAAGVGSTSRRNFLVRGLLTFDTVRLAPLPHRDRMTLPSRPLRLLVPLVFAVACGEEAPPAPPSLAAAPRVKRSARVEVATIEPSSTSLTLRLPGEVEGGRDALLAASLGGFVERVLVDEGDDVREGQLLATVDLAVYGAAVEQARVELTAAERELARAERLGEALAQQQRDSIETRLAAPHAAVRAASARSSRARVRAPFAGTVAQVAVERGEVAAPGAPLVRLVQLDPVRVTISVADRDVVALRPGTPAQVRPGATGQIIEGHISGIHPAADLDTRTFLVEIEVPNPGRRLLPGMIAQVEVEPSAAVDRVILPQYVLVTRLHDNGVFVEEHGVARWRAVEIAEIVRDQVVIGSGVELGDRVIVTGHRELVDGDAVLVGREGRCCRAGRVEFSATSAEPRGESNTPAPTTNEDDAP